MTVICNLYSVPF